MDNDEVECLLANMIYKVRFCFSPFLLMRGSETRQFLIHPTRTFDSSEYLGCDAVLY